MLHMEVKTNLDSTWVTLPPPKGQGPLTLFLELENYAYEEALCS